MIQQSKLALEIYHRQGIGVPHNCVRQWANSLGTEQERPLPFSLLVTPRSQQGNTSSIEYLSTRLID